MIEREETKDNNTRILYLDRIKILASFFVVIIHVSSYFFIYMI
ncbi:MAG: hypothetical protein ACI4T8_01500 [Christensenellales bacterium]